MLFSAMSACRKSKMQNRMGEQKATWVERKKGRATQLGPKLRPSTHTTLLFPNGAHRMGHWGPPRRKKGYPKARLENGSRFDFIINNDVGNHN